MVEPSEEVKEGSTHGKIRRKDLSSYPDVSIVVGELQFEDSFFHKSSKDYAVFEGDTHTRKGYSLYHWPCPPHPPPLLAVYGFPDAD